MNILAAGILKDQYAVWTRNIIHFVLNTFSGKSVNTSVLLAPDYFFIKMLMRKDNKLKCINLPKHAKKQQQHVSSYISRRRCIVNIHGKRQH